MAVTLFLYARKNREKCLKCRSQKELQFFLSISIFVRGCISPGTRFVARRYGCLRIINAFDVYVMTVTDTKATTKTKTTKRIRRSTITASTTTEPLVATAAATTRM